MLAKQENIKEFSFLNNVTFSIQTIKWIQTWEINILYADKKLKNIQKPKYLKS